MVEAGLGTVEVAAGLVFWVVVGMAGVVDWVAPAPVAVPGAVVAGIAGVVPLAPVVWAAATPKQRLRTAAIMIARVVMELSS